MKPPGGTGSTRGALSPVGTTRRWPEVVNLWEEDGYPGLAASFHIFAEPDVWLYAIVSYALLCGALGAGGGELAHRAVGAGAREDAQNARAVEAQGLRHLVLRMDKAHTTPSPMMKTEGSRSISWRIWLVSVST